AAEFGGELLARREAAVDVEQLEQVDDRRAPVELLGIRRGALLELGDDVDDRDRLRLRRAAGRCRAPRRGGGLDGRLGGLGTADAELFEDLAEETHGRSPEGWVGIITIRHGRAVFAWCCDSSLTRGSLARVRNRAGTAGPSRAGGDVR